MATGGQKNLNRTRYARQALVVLSVFPKIMRELVSHSVQPNAMFNLIPHLAIIRDKLTYDEKKIVQTLPTDGYEKCDTILLYKFIRQQLPKPGRGWGKNPVNSNLAISDDVERIRLARNSLLHRPKPEITEEEEIQFFDEFLDVGRRVDKYLKKPQEDCFELEISNWKGNSINLELEEKSIKLAQEIEGLKLKLKDEMEKRPLSIYLGKHLEAVIKSDKRTETDKKTLKIIVRGAAEEQEVIDQLNHLKDEINAGNYQIILKKADNGSIIIYITLAVELLQTSIMLCKTIFNYLQHIFVKLNVQSDSKTGFSAFVLLFDELLDNDYEELMANDDLTDEFDDDDDVCYNPDDLVLTVKVNKDAFSTDNEFYQETSEFVKDILRRTNDTHQLLESTDPLSVIVRHVPTEEMSDLVNKRIQSSMKVSLPCNLGSQQTIKVNSDTTYKQAQSSVKVSLPCKLSLRQTLKVNKGRFELYLQDCVIVNNKIIFTEHFGKRLIIHNFNGSLDRNIRLPYHPFGITAIDNQTVGVTSKEKRKIDFINILTGDIKKTITATEKCYGISYCKELLYVIVGRNIHVYDKLGYLNNSFALRSANVLHLTIARDKIYYTDHAKNTINCCDLNGTTLWTTSPPALSCPDGVTVDDDGNAIVVGYSSENIILVSPKGTFHRVLETRSGGLTFPTGVYYDSKRKVLLVCNECDENAFVYDLEGVNDEKDVDV